MVKTVSAPKRNGTKTADYLYSSEYRDKTTPKLTGRVHFLKTVEPVMTEVMAGLKTGELREDDREFQVGDLLVMCRYDRDSKSYKRGIAIAVVTTITRNGNNTRHRWLADGIVMLSFRLVQTSTKLVTTYVPWLNADPNTNGEPVAPTDIGADADEIEQEDLIAA